MTSVQRAWIAIAVVACACGTREQARPEPAPAPKPAPLDAAPVLAETAVIGDYGPIEVADADLPAGVVKASACHRLTLAADHTLVHECDAGWKSDGEWALSNGVLYYRITKQSAKPTNHWGALTVRVVGSYVCFDETTPAAPWPDGRDLGKRVDAPEGGLPAACLEKY